MVLFHTDSLMPVFSFPDHFQPVCQTCPQVDELPSLKMVMDALCLTDFGKQNHKNITVDLCKESMLCLEVLLILHCQHCQIG